MLVGRFRSSPPLLLLLLLLLHHNTLGLAIQAACSACLAIADELQAALITEQPGQAIVTGQRTDSRGRRTSKKKVDWAVSETRAIEILEKICMGMDSYMLSNAEDEASQEQRPEKTPEASFAYWQKVGIGRDYIIDGPVVFGASNDIQKSELLNFCHMTVERVEDAIIEAVRQARSDIREHFCEELLPYCRGEEGSKEKIRRANDPKYTGGDKDWMRKLKDDL
mmetsp:Transcript_10967/g.40201  ORF Transcript_10967/g.40201 Transcript_10967/m.40201 type:complete len:223 (-) Transcript_10967:3333-4001(-)